MRQIEIERVEYQGGTLAILHGQDIETGERVSFGADWRPAQDINDALAAGESPVGLVEDWQILQIQATGQ